MGTKMDGSGDERRILTVGCCDFGSAQLVFEPQSRPVSGKPISMISLRGWVPKRRRRRIESHEHNTKWKGARHDRPALSDLSSDDHRAGLLQRHGTIHRLLVGPHFPFLHHKVYSQALSCALGN
jgi:hypothetical protein